MSATGSRDYFGFHTPSPAPPSFSTSSQPHSCLWPSPSARFPNYPPPHPYNAITAMNVTVTGQPALQQVRPAGNNVRKQVTGAGCTSAAPQFDVASTAYNSQPPRAHQYVCLSPPPPPPPSPPSPPSPTPTATSPFMGHCPCCARHGTGFIVHPSPPWLPAPLSPVSAVRSAEHVAPPLLPLTLAGVDDGDEKLAEYAQVNAYDAAQLNMPPLYPSVESYISNLILRSPLSSFSGSSSSSCSSVDLCDAAQPASPGPFALSTFAQSGSSLGWSHSSVSHRRPPHFPAAYQAYQDARSASTASSSADSHCASPVGHSCPSKAYSTPSAGSGVTLRSAAAAAAAAAAAVVAVVLSPVSVRNEKRLLMNCHHCHHTQEPSETLTCQSRRLTVSTVSGSASQQTTTSKRKRANKGQETARCCRKNYCRSGRPIAPIVSLLLSPSSLLSPPHPHPHPPTHPHTLIRLPPPAPL